MTDETTNEFTGAVSRAFCKRGRATSRIGVGESTDSKAELGCAFDPIQNARRTSLGTGRQRVVADTDASEVVSK